jgi:inner membrane transporter RhtA
MVACRPSITLWRAHWKLYLPAGLVVCVHHLAYYEAISRIPLGTATTIEFVGPFVLTLRFSHAWHQRAWGCLAFAGVVVLCRPNPTTDWVGIVSAAAAAASWATYIVFARALTRHSRGASLALTLTVAAAASFVLGGFRVVPQLGDTGVIGLGVCVALLSSVAPYTLQLRALRDLTPRTFGVLLSLEPAVAAAVGLVFLHQNLTWPQWLGVSAVMTASIGATRGRDLPEVQAND